MGSIRNYRGQHVEQIPNDLALPKAGPLLRQILTATDLALQQMQRDLDAAGITTAGTSTTVLGQNALLDGVNHTDTLAGTVVRGDLIVGNSTPEWARYALGTVGKIIRSDGTDALWSATTWPNIGTSGGLLYFSSTTAVASSALLAANQLVLGGGAGVTPATLGSLGTTTTVLHGNAGGAPTFGAVSLTADVTGILPIANGGTSGATALAAFDALSPLTTRGDLLTRDATNNVRVAVGTANAVPWTDGTDVKWNNTPTSGTAHIDFKTAKAIAMACDNGTTLPTSPTPTEGQWFLHEPTGRKILLQRIAGAWIPIFSFTTMTIFVDATNGSDSSQNNGTTVFGGAGTPFATLNFAFAQIPGLCAGNVTVNIAAGTYSSEAVVLDGKKGTGNFSITLQGNVAGGATIPAVDGGTTGALSGVSSTQPTITNSAVSWTANAYNGAIIKITGASANNGLIRIVDNNTTGTITLCGAPLTTAPVGTDTYTIQPLDTIISRTTGNTFRGRSALAFALSINDIKFVNTGSGNALIIDSLSGTIVSRCEMSGGTQPVQFVNTGASSNSLTTCVVYPTGANGKGVLVSTASNLSVQVGTLIRNISGSGTQNQAINANRGSYVIVRDGSVLDGNNPAGGATSFTVAVYATTQSVFETVASTQAVFVKNSTVGFGATSTDALGWSAFAFASTVFTAVTTNISPVFLSQGITLGGDVAETMQVARHPTANTAGNALTINAGGARAASTNKAAGNLILASGLSTGSGNGQILLQTPTTNAASTTDNTLVTRMTIDGTGVSGVESMNILVLDGDVLTYEDEVVFFN